MLIRSQNKNIICNLDNVAGLRIVNQCDKAFEIHADAVNNEYLLGKYGTEERAKRVLDDIMKTHLAHVFCGSRRNAAGFEQAFGFVRPKAYEMPAE